MLETVRRWKGWTEGGVLARDYPDIASDVAQILRETQEEADGIVAERDNLAADLASCMAERDELRERLGKALDYAHAILALQDLEGKADDD